MAALDESTVPIVDIAPFAAPSLYDDAARATAARAWDAAMTEVGFAVIVGHGVPAKVVEDLRAGAGDFFSRDAAEKLAYRHGPYGNPLGGYTAMGTEAPDEATRPKPPALEAAGRAYHAALLGVLDTLHAVTAAALGLPAGFFDEFYAPGADVSLRLAYYPPVPAAARNSSAVRYGEHTDYTGFTILLQDDADVGDLGAGGLQVLRKSGAWTAVRPVRGAFVVNIGDLYEIWTNGRWRSTVHRVMKPPPDSPAADAPRLSIPFFTGPHGDAVIEAMPTCVDDDHPAKYAPVKALDHPQQARGVEYVDAELNADLRADVFVDARREVADAALRASRGFSDRIRALAAKHGIDVAADATSDDAPMDDAGDDDSDDDDFFDDADDE
ncbi:hypothetical protein JL722_4808 [Aureococcus anophagefferens]|nr:hypothetical protein JL722_4808 [Aureococcus anophagefferens]